MKNEILLKIREEVSNRLQNLDKDNDYARKREEVEFEEGITQIPAFMFRETGIEEIILPNTITDIGTAAFLNCKNLRKIDFTKRKKISGQ